MKVDAFELDYKPKLPPQQGDGIAIVGCGVITAKAHRPIYRKHNLNILGCFDAKREMAKSFAKQFSIPWVEMTEVFAHEG